eukprot:CAMPEP_0115844982 /NCGR_PEP_ID=MMETSP0287-20121206/9110_1 /TAXON_ID=412157 /ORGANISM="Chrysochromulina rotalis, Strain UIO044" /LENGTH=152 /DNA_ID=CAMNT_0003298727 /DNA_START=104 /DNA_END=563 /DNA_ORIENTATION=+
MRSMRLAWLTPVRAASAAAGTKEADACGLLLCQTDYGCLRRQPGVRGGREPARGAPPQITNWASRRGRSGSEKLRWVALGGPLCVRQPLPLPERPAKGVWPRPATDNLVMLHRSSGKAATALALRADATCTPLTLTHARLAPALTQGKTSAS